jgi:N-acetylglucosaminyl-diphospho-decaprenol L-rhamnosyltransferase
MNATPLVSAIILNFRSAKDTWACTEALQNQTIADKLEILIVDNASGDESVPWLRNRIGFTKANVRLIENACNSGYGQGNELGVQHSHGTYILIINPDNRLEPTGLAELIALLEQDPSIGLVAPKLVHEDGTIRSSVRAFPHWSDLVIKRAGLGKFFRQKMDHYLQEHDTTTAPHDVDWIAGACFVMRKDVYETLGGFDPRFFLFFEDTDLCRRCWQAGKRVVYAPGITARDRKRRLSDGGVLSIFTKRIVRIHFASALRYFWKWRGQALPR